MAPTSITYSTSTLFMIILNVFLCTFSMVTFPWYETNKIAFAVFASSSICIFASGMIGLYLFVSAEWNRIASIVYSLACGTTMIMHCILCVVIASYLQETSLNQIMARGAGGMLMGAIMVINGKLEVAAFTKETEESCV